MSEVIVTEELKTTASKLWELASNFGDLSWSSAIESCTVKGKGVGAVRTLKLKGSADSLQERLEAFDPATRSYAYRIIGKNPLPLDDYLATVKISDLGADRCRIDWRGSFVPRGAPEAQAQALVEGIYRGAIKAYRAKLEK